jgi:hypothetical protein
MKFWRESAKVPLLFFKNKRDTWVSVAVRMIRV